MPQQSDELRLLRHIADLRFEEELRGYSKSQVDRVLQKLAPLADDYEELHRKLSQAETRAASAEARLLERGVSEDAAVPAAAAVAEPDSTPESAAAVSATQTAVPDTPADFDETLRKTLLLAQRTADETVKEAYDEADRITNNAHSEADLVLGKARTEAERVTTETEQRRIDLQAELDSERTSRLLQIDTETETRRVQLETALADAEGSERAELLEQIANLQAVRSTLSGDIENLEGHLAARREAIQSALDEVATVLEEPGRLRSDGPPALAEVAPVHAGDYSDVGIDVDAHITDSPGQTEPPEVSDTESGSTAIDGDDASADSSQGEVLAADSGVPADAEAEPEGVTSEVVGEMQTDDGQVDVVLERDSNEELPDLPQRRKAGDETEADADTSTDDESTADEADDEAFEAVSADTADSQSAANESGDNSEPISIAEAIPSIDEVGPAPDAAGPPTQEFSFADVEIEEVSDSATSETISPPLPPSADAEPALAVDGWNQTDADDSADVAQRPAWMEEVPDTVEDGPPPPPPGTQDPFLDQLRKATSEEPAASDEALNKFLDGDQDDAERRPWFGRRR